MSLKKKYLLRIFFLNIFLLFCFPLLLNSETDSKYYRSNSNGLELLKIDYNQRRNYKYYVQMNYIDNILKKKILFENGREIKRWEYFYSGNKLNYEKYFKERIIKEDYRYDQFGHIIKKSEYKRSRGKRTYNSRS